MAEMSPLRRRMIEDMTVRNLSPATQRSYVHAVSKFSRYFGRSPELLGLEDVRAFQVHLVATGISWPALNQTVCALRFFYGVTLGHGEIPELGVPTLEDKIVQGAVAGLLSAIYEVDFLGFSYGFRPGRNPHQALAAIHTAVMTQCVNWVLDADIRKFFDSVDHEWLLRMIAHRIADPRVLRLIRMWLKAGVLEGGRWH